MPKVSRGPHRSISTQQHQAKQTHEFPTNSGSHRQQAALSPLRAFGYKMIWLYLNTVLSNLTLVTSVDKTLVDIKKTSEMVYLNSQQFTPPPPPGDFILLSFERGRGIDQHGLFNYWGIGLIPLHANFSAKEDFFPFFHQHLGLCLSFFPFYCCVLCFGGVIGSENPVGC